MGILQRIHASTQARSAAAVWAAETSLLHACALVRAPVAVQWIATSACDLHCPHCYSAAGRRATDELSTAQARERIIDELVRLGSPTLVFAGGEMSLRRDMPELIEYAVARGLPYAVHTHGGHVERLHPVFARHPPSLAAISIDGDELHHDAFRGRTGSFAAALRAIAVLVECGCPEIVVGTTVTRRNADELEALFPIVARSGAHTWGLHLFAPEGRGAEHQALLPTAAQLRRVVEYARRRRGSFHVELCNEWGSAGADDRYLRDQPFSCGAGRISFVIASNGDVMPCTTTDVREREGNVRDRPLHEIWAQGFGRFRRPTTDATLDARECWLQTRNGVEIRRHAFGPTIDAPPLPLERLTRALVRRARPAVDGRGAVASSRASAAVRWAAIGLTFLDGCVREVRTPAPSGGTDEPVRGTAPATGGRGHGEPTVGEIGLVELFPEDLAAAPVENFALRRHGHQWGEMVRALLANEAGVTPAPDLETTADRLGRGGKYAALAEVLTAHARARAADRPQDLADLVGMLNALEHVPAYDAAFAAYLWRRARTVPVTDAATSARRVTLFARLHRHLRVADALLQAQSVTGPVEFTAWRSKAAPPPAWSGDPTVPAGLVDAARKAFADRGDIPWDRVAVELRVVGDGSTRGALLRGGRPIALVDGTRVRLGRLDVLRAESELRLRDGGGLEVRVPAGTELTLDRLAEHLGAADVRTLEALVERAAAGDGEADARIEATLPWCQALLRAWLRAHPQHDAAGKVRMWLVIFDE